MSSPNSSPSKCSGEIVIYSFRQANETDQRWPTGHSGRTQRIAGQVFPSLSRSPRKPSLAETLERLRTISLESKAMSENLIDEISQVEKPAESGEPHPHEAAAHSDWMAGWRSGALSHRNEPQVATTGASYDPRTETELTTQSAEPFFVPRSRLSQPNDVTCHCSDADSAGPTSAEQEHPRPLLLGSDFFAPLSLSPALARAEKKVQQEDKCRSSPAFPPAYASLPRPDLRETWPKRPTHPSDPDSSRDHLLAASNAECPRCTKRAALETAPKCTDCADLRHELEFIHLQLRAQQSALDRIVAELATRRSAPPPGARFSSAQSQTPRPPWRAPYDHLWYAGHGLPPPHVMRLPPFPPRYYADDHWNGNVSEAHTAYPTAFPGTCQEPVASVGERSSTAAPRSSTINLSSPSGDRTGTPLSAEAGRDHNALSLDRRSPKRVSFACPMTQSEAESNDSSEEILISDSDTEKPVPPTPGRASSQLSRKSSPPSKKTSPSSTARLKPFPLTGSFKHQPAPVYSPKSPRTFYGNVCSGQESLPRSLRGLGSSGRDAKKMSPGSDDALPHVSDVTSPSVVPTDEERGPDTEALRVRFNARTLSNFMQYWEQNADKDEPLLVSLALDFATYQGFRTWCFDSSTRK